MKSNDKGKRGMRSKRELIPPDLDHFKPDLCSYFANSFICHTVFFL